jgi:hypothetical protein
MASLEADNLVAFHSFSASEIWPEKRASFFYLDVNKLYNFSSKPFYIICLINFMKKIHLHKSYIKYLRRYMFQLKQNKSK